MSFVTGNFAGDKSCKMPRTPRRCPSLCTRPSEIKKSFVNYKQALQICHQSHWTHIRHHGGHVDVEAVGDSHGGSGGVNVCEHQGSRILQSHLPRLFALQLGSLRSQINCSLRSRSSHADRRRLPIARVARSFSTFRRHSFHRITPADRRHLPIARRITHACAHADRHHLPIDRVAHSFSAFRRPYSYHSHRITCTKKGIICLSLALLAHSALSGDTACTLCPLGAPPGGWFWCHLVARIAMIYPDHPPKFQPNRPTDSWEKPHITLQQRPLVADQGATWWKVC